MTGLNERFYFFQPFGLPSTDMVTRLRSEGSRVQIPSPSKDGVAQPGRALKYHIDSMAISSGKFVVYRDGYMHDKHRGHWFKPSRRAICVAQSGRALNDHPNLTTISLPSTDKITCCSSRLSWVRVPSLSQDSVAQMDRAPKVLLST
jgi:hypothetical protein